jgi:hypothetical protein
MQVYRCVFVFGGMETAKTVEAASAGDAAFIAARTVNYREAESLSVWLDGELICKLSGRGWPRYLLRPVKTPQHAA